MKKIVKIFIICSFIVFISNYVIIQAEGINKATYSYMFMNYEGTSNFSQDDAWYDATSQSYENEEITELQWEYHYLEYMEDYAVTEVVEEVNPASVTYNSTSNKTIVKGQITWKYDSGNNDISTLKYAKIELHRNVFGINGYSVVSKCLASGYTDQNGNYEFELSEDEFNSNNANIFIKVYPISETFKVSLDWVFLKPCVLTKLDAKLSTGQTKTINMLIPQNNEYNIYNMFHIHQRMVIGENFAQEMGFSPNSILNVQYPFNNKIPFSYCGFCAVGETYYNDVDGLIHEYGHFVEQQMGNYASGIADFIINDPNHNYKQDHFEDKENKAYAMQLTWTEAWANVFSELAQQYYKSDYTEFSGFADETYDTIDLNNQILDSNACEAQEQAVFMTLWDIIDSDSSESHDEVNVTYAKWWNLTTKPGTYTLEDFVNKLADEEFELRIKIYRLLEYHQIAPKEVKIENTPSVTEPPIIKWITNGSLMNPNNVFDIVFYDLEGNEVYAVSGLEFENYTYTSQLSYTISDADWTNILNKFCNNVNAQVLVKGCRKGASKATYTEETEYSGPYSSKPIEIKCEKYVRKIEFENPSINESLDFNCPTFEWTASGGIDIYHENKFSIICSDAKGVLVETPYVNDFSYTLTETEWDTILNSGSQELSFKIKWMQLTEFDESQSTSEVLILYVPLVTTITLETTCTDELTANGCQWYKFKAPYTGLYNFYTCGETDTYGSIFEMITSSHSYDNAIIHNDDCEYDCYEQCGQMDNFCMTIHLDENEEVYIRVNGFTWSVQGIYELKVYSEHECAYNYRYVKHATRTHNAFCSCGDFITESHAAIAGTRKCMKCLAIISDPILELMNNQVLLYSDKGSYILNNGIIYLVRDDITAYLNGTLTFKKKDNETI